MKVIGPAGATMLFFGVLALFSPEGAMAADPAWRPTYDLAMRWINFIILVAVIVKYAREPIKDFLMLKKQDVASQIESLDKKKARILAEIEAVKQQGMENEARFEELKTRLISQGETHKQQIIEQAKRQSTIMIEAARIKMGNQIIHAKASLKMELLDMAMDQAVQQLPELITDKDNQGLLDDYMRSI
jgi:F-type H+-transporting ATPase subunit b